MKMRTLMVTIAWGGIVAGCGESAQPLSPPAVPERAAVSDGLTPHVHGVSGKASLLLTERVIEEDLAELKAGRVPQRFHD